LTAAQGEERENELSMKDWNSRLLIGVVIAAAAALIPLAWLQYRWIGQLSEANEERLRSHLMASMSGFRQDFMQQVSRAAFEEEGFVERSHSARRLPDGTLHFYPEVDGLSAEAPWPAGMEGVREHLERGAPPGTIVDGPIPVILLPRMRVGMGNGGMGNPGMGRGGPRPGEPGMGGGMMGGPPPGRGPEPPGRGPDRPGEMRPPGPPPMMGYRIAVLNLEAIRSKLLPELADRWFSRNGEAAYFVRVKAGEKTFFESGAFTEADATSPLSASASDWRVEVRHKEEPLRSVVDGTRRRNLAVSFGILLALATGLAVIFFSMRRAHELARLQMEFVAGVSHELRTPLSVICSAGDNLAEGHVTAADQVKKYGAVIRLEGRRLSQMVEQVLSYASAESGRARLALKPVDIGRMVAGAVEMSGDGVKVEAGDAIGSVMGDEAALMRAVRNLVDNALIHGGAPVTVRVATAGETARIAVEDHGAGLPEDELKRVWDPFYRGRGAQEEQRPGSGLGLALVQRIAEEHGGRVEAENLVAGGARFTLILPRTEDRGDDERASHPAG
jgi:signal transduction histidine kinase